MRMEGLYLQVLSMYLIMKDMEPYQLLREMDIRLLGGSHQKMKMG